jgi:hypothetical protein
MFLWKIFWRVIRRSFKWKGNKVRGTYCFLVLAHTSTWYPGLPFFHVILCLKAELEFGIYPLGMPQLFLLWPPAACWCCLFVVLIVMDRVRWLLLAHSIRRAWEKCWMRDPFETQEVGNPRATFALHFTTWQQCGMVWLAKPLFVSSHCSDVHIYLNVKILGHCHRSN